MNEKKDILGNALKDYFEGEKGVSLEVCSEGFDNDFMDVSYYFRDLKNMPEIEKEALKQAKGKVLEVGAGAGSHALVLQKEGVDVSAIDISPGAVEVMKSRGVMNVRCLDIYQLIEEKYDTILILMNGIGIAGELEKLPEFIDHLMKLLKAKGKIIVDSTDLRYLYENEDGSFSIDLNASYYGELRFRFKYKSEFSDWFPWLYVDADKLKQICIDQGCKMELVFHQDEYHYLAVINKR